MTPPRAVPHEIQPFTPEEAKELLQAARGDRLQALYAVALAIGLRRGEALGLTWDCLDVEHGQLAVKKALQRQKGGLTLVGAQNSPVPSHDRPTCLRRRSAQGPSHPPAGREVGGRFVPGKHPRGRHGGGGHAP